MEIDASDLIINKSSLIEIAESMVYTYVQNTSFVKQY